MANDEISMQQLYDAWKTLEDWVKGSSTDKPKVVNVNGSGTEIFTDETPGAVKLAGRYVKELKFMETNFWIGKTSHLGYIHSGSNFPNTYSDTTPIDCRHFEPSVFLKNGYDQHVNVTIYGHLRPSGSQIEDRLVVVAQEPLAAGASKFYNKDSYPLFSASIFGLCIAVTSSSPAPTTGTLRALVIGRV